MGIGENDTLFEEFLKSPFERGTEALEVLVAPLIDGDEQDKTRLFAWGLTMDVSDAGRDEKIAQNGARQQAESHYSRCESLIGS